MIDMLRKLAASVLWDMALLLNWIAEEFISPLKSDPLATSAEDDRPEDQYPVGTLVVTRTGQTWQLQRSGRWLHVEQDGEPLDPLAPDCRCLNDAYCPDCEDDDK